MKTQVYVSISRAELIAFARRHSEPADAIPDDARIQVYYGGSYTEADHYREADPIRVVYEVEHTVGAP